MTWKLTRISPVINGYSVVVAQEPDQGATPGKLIGCFLQAPESGEDGPMGSLKNAMDAFILRTAGNGCDEVSGSRSKSTRV